MKTPKYSFDPADPKAPPDEVWDAMTPEERQSLWTSLNELQNPRSAHDPLVAEKAKIFQEAIEERLLAERLERDIAEKASKLAEMRQATEEIRRRREEVARKTEEAQQRIAEIEAEIARLKKQQPT